MNRNNVCLSVKMSSKTTRKSIKILIIVAILFVLTNITFFLAYSNGFFTPQDELNVKNPHFSARMHQRRAAIDEICKKQISNYSLKSPHVKHVLRRLFVDTKHRISWCPIYKAASSVWMKGFAELGGALDKKTKQSLLKGILQWNTVARNAFPVEKNTNTIFQKLNRTKKFILVRHPFERILAAYRDKIENGNSKEYRSYMRKNYRKNWANRNRDESSFEEFLKFIVKNMGFEENWIPMSIQCLPCFFHYDYIIHTDTFTPDNYFMLLELGLDTKIAFYRSDDENNDRRTTYKSAKYYYSNIPLKLMKKVYEFYKDDFDLFGYSPDEYFQIAKTI